VRKLVWIDERDVFALHAQLPALHGGAPGLRDLGLLQSALARPKQHLAYTKPANLIDMAAIYTAGVVRNRPFVMGTSAPALSLEFSFSN
jgi:death on curing protein